MNGNRPIRDVLVCCEPSFTTLQQFVETTTDPLIFRFFQTIDELEKSLTEKDTAVILDLSLDSSGDKELLRNFLSSRRREVYVIGIMREVRSDQILKWLDSGVDDILFKISLIQLLQDSLSQWQAVKNAENNDEERMRLFFRHRYELAERLQNAILYRSFEQIHQLSFDSSILFKAQSGNLSGDYYNFHTNRKGELEVFLADAIGHGINAAKLTLEIDKIIMQAQNVTSLNEKMQFLNKEWNQLPGRKTFFSGFICKIADQAIEYISAGHPSGYLLKQSGSVISLFTGGKLLGIKEQSEYQVKQENYDKGDVLIIVTDGMYEQLNKDQEEYGEERLQSTLKSIHQYGQQITTTSINKIIYDDLKAFLAGAPFLDDLSCICLRLN